MSTHAAAEASGGRWTGTSGHVLAIALLGAAASLLVVVLGWSSPLISHPHVAAAVRGLFVATYVGVGAYTWSRRPASRIGPLITGAGFLYAVVALAAVDDPLPYTIGRVALAAQVVYFAFLFITFPRERPSTRLERRFLGVAAAATVVVWAVTLALVDTLPHGGPLTDCTPQCPGNALQVVETSDGVTSALGLLATVLSALIVLGLIAVLSRKAASATLIRRRVVVPLLYASILFVATYATYSLVSQVGDTQPGPGLRVVAVAGAFAVPLALLYGQLRGRLFAAASLWRTMGRAGPRQVTPAQMQDFLGETLGDPSFELLVWSPERNVYVDVSGEPVELAEPSPSRSITRVAQAGSPSLALVHDAELDDDPETVRGLGAAASALLENVTLVRELQASRARIVDSAEQERHRLERDLHDGAQQRLTTIQLRLALAQERAPDGQLGDELAELETEAATAAAELRALAHGIYPALLADAGLAPALRSFASSATIPIRVVDHGVGRAQAGTELAIYYCVLEALQNVVKHAGPRAGAVVTLTRARDTIGFEIRDDGAGFDRAGHTDGIGLVSMRDRIGAAGGTLEIHSSPGAGATVYGSVPAGGQG
jgi:signal transduction histidine kinase